MSKLLSKKTREDGERERERERGDKERGERGERREREEIEGGGESKKKY